MQPMKPGQIALEDAAAMRCADGELLSLALMHARNRTLAWLTVLERLADARWLAGRAGWWQERWIARNVQRSRGAAADATRAPLASIEPLADDWWSQLPSGERAARRPKRCAPTSPKRSRSRSTCWLPRTAATRRCTGTAPRCSKKTRSCSAWRCWRSGTASTPGACCPSACCGPCVRRCGFLRSVGRWARRAAASCRRPSNGRMKSRCPSSRSMRSL